MLDQKTILTIKSTVPVLKEYGTAITSRFYELLFKNHPELLNLFNHSNQHKGRQQGALSNAVYAAAVHIDRLEEILPAVKQIAHKHRSLGVKPEQYPIVGENLLAAIKEVLGDAATDEILEAWAKAYQVIADVFIQVESEMYEEAEIQEGGWKDFREFKLVRKDVESKVITSFYLQPVDGKDVASFLPGQYVSVKVQIPNDPHTHIRQYSLSDAPGKGYYRLSIKREGRVSMHLHDNIEVGDSLFLSAPAGDFSLKMNEEKPLVLIGAGVGLTPLVSMLETTLSELPNRKIHYFHAAINGDYQAMGDRIQELVAQHENLKAHFCFEHPTEQDQQNQCFALKGRMDMEWLQTKIPLDADFYICGPEGFMKMMIGGLNQFGVSPEQINYEFFGPAIDLDNVMTVKSGA
ncbi:NO-inducible flavohemoprotein [Pseudalkalibacillus berkeleyi]|uniref:Flavohemoprotein n=1 Tax=Pseudalkalibacillus berkeleyi TaxID=1069813 RepID=A0ABS9H217_9BACL|nr:NO-inducible flavohemoprotein [Pseudalkalibacillus berkeleyi]MCF6139018.1 NO-inducible flavohemoprotein [Pseudalkalibacillus berkeleyi]